MLLPQQVNSDRKQAAQYRQTLKAINIMANLRDGWINRLPSSFRGVMKILTLQF